MPKFPIADNVGEWGWIHLAYFGLLLPLLAFRNRKRLLGIGAPLPNRLRLFKGMLFSHVVFAAFSLAIAHEERIPLFPNAWPPPLALAAGFASYIAVVALMRPLWRKSIVERDRAVHIYMPSNPAERRWWMAVSIMAGVGEEISWRGVQFALLLVFVGDYWLAMIVSSVSFALVHIAQGWKSIAVVFLISLGFHGLVWLSDSLYVAMAVHVVYDITVGRYLGRLARISHRASPLLGIFGSDREIWRVGVHASG